MPNPGCELQWVLFVQGTHWFCEQREAEALVQSALVSHWTQVLRGRAGLPPFVSLQAAPEGLPVQSASAAHSTQRLTPEMAAQAVLPSTAAQSF
jgi:hypothetical protein